MSILLNPPRPLVPRMTRSTLSWDAKSTISCTTVPVDVRAFSSYPYSLILGCGHLLVDNFPRRLGCRLDQLLVGGLRKRNAGAEPEVVFDGRNHAQDDQVRFVLLSQLHGSARRPFGVFRTVNSQENTLEIRTVTQ